MPSNHVDFQPGGTEHQDQRSLRALSPRPEHPVHRPRILRSHDDPDVTRPPRHDVTPSTDDVISSADHYLISIRPEAGNPLYQCAGSRGRGERNKATETLRPRGKRAHEQSGGC